MPQYGRAGVYTTEQLAVAVTTTAPTGPSIAGLLGEHWRGPVDQAIYCNSWAQFVLYFGGFNPTPVPVLANPYLAFAAYEFFANGGQNLYVSRIASSGSPGATASVTLLDSSATPQPTLELQAGGLGLVGNPGTWGNNLSVSIANRGGAGSGRFDLAISYNGATGISVVESWIDLSMNTSDFRYAVAVLNSASSGSNWVTATDLSDPSSPPNNAPAVVSGADFTGGVDPGDPSVGDRVAAVTYGTAPFDSIQISGVINFNLPGEVNTTVLDAAIVYAGTRPYSFLVMDTPVGQTPAAAVAFLQSLTPTSSYAAMYYPWVITSDPSSNSFSNTKTLPPGAFVLGQMAQVDAASGVWTATAGIRTVLNAIQTERLFTPSDLDTLNENNVNALKTLANGAVVIWGARTMETGYASMYIPIRRTLNFLESSFSQLLQFAVFQPNDPITWGIVAGVLNQFLGGLWGQNAFAGNSSAQAFNVVCDSSNNTPSTVQQGVINASVGVALLYPAEFIQIFITQIQSTGATTTSATV